jgi:hypothetical protein
VPDKRPIQLRREDLATMTASEIVQAHREGRLDDLLAGKPVDYLETEQAKRLLQELDEAREGADHGSADQGARRQTLGQITERATLRTMTASEIVRAQNEGRLDRLLGRIP